MNRTTWPRYKPAISLGVSLYGIYIVMGLRSSVHKSLRDLHLTHDVTYTNSDVFLIGTFFLKGPQQCLLWYYVTQWVNLDV